MRAWSSVLLFASLVAFAPAQMLYSSSFEAPAFNPGALNGQSGWFAVNGYSVSNTIAKSGSQSVLWDNEFGSNASIGFSPYTGPIEMIAEVSVWIERNGASTERSFGLTLFGGNQGNAWVVGLTVNSAGLVRAGDNPGAVYTGSGVGTVSNATGRWLDLGIRYTPGSSTATVQADTFSTAISVNPVSSVATVGLYSDWDSSPIRSKGYFDDLSVQAVPEPATLAVLGVGAMALARRRRAGR